VAAYNFYYDIEMKKLSILLVLAIMKLSSCTEKAPENIVLVKGGAFKNVKSNSYGKDISISDFFIGKYEVTQKEWVEIMEINPSKFEGNNMPVETVSWYDCIEYCNKRSIKEGLTPYYNIDKTTKDPENTNYLDDIKWTITTNIKANGYRLPTEKEWEYAAGGGQTSKNYKYSGSNNIDDVAWFWQNAGDSTLTGAWDWNTIEHNNCKTKPVGIKKSNELGLFDMSGNVREWCWDWHELKGPDPTKERAWRGGGWIGGDFCCELSFQGNHQANGKGADQGFRVCRNK
jgi:formylglycine-generating enzyme